MSFKLLECRFRWLSVNLLLLAVCLAGAPTAFAQEAAPVCSAADLDASYRFLNSPSNEKVIVTFQNISPRSCTLSAGASACVPRGVGWVSFGDYRHGHNIWTTNCFNYDAEGKPRSQPPITIATGQSAYLTVGWDIVSVVSTACQEGGTLNGFGFSMWAGNLLGDVCSVVHIDAYYLGTFDSGNTTLRIEASPKPQPVAIKLSPSGGVFYGDDSFWLYADISDPSGILPLDARSCPPMFIKTRTSDGANWFEEIGGQCHVTENGPGLGRSIRMKIWTMGRGAFVGAETRAEVLALLSGPHAPEVEMASSNAIVLHRVESSTLERKWGTQVKGIAVSLSLDKHEYLVGEDIPLRLAVENFSAASDIWSGELPCGAGLTVDVRDSDGRAVESFATSVCTGHGWTQGYPQEKLVPVLGLTLSGQGRLPDRAGDYIVTVAWQPFAGRAPQKGVVIQGSSAPPNPYAIARSVPVAFRVVPQRQ